MKFILIIFCLFIYFFQVFTQVGSLKLEETPNDQYQMTSNAIFSPNSTSHMLKKIYSLVNTPKFIIENMKSPEYPNNIKYTESKSSVIYIIELPHFPSFITKDDIIIEKGVAGVKVKVKDSGLYHNDAFFPDLTENTLSSIVRGRDYELVLHFFNKIQEGNENLVDSKINEKDDNSYEIILTVPKKILEPQPLLNKVNRLFVKSINTVASPEKIKKMQEEIKKPFLRSERTMPGSGLKMEIFKKNEDGDEKGNSDFDVLDVKNYFPKQNYTKEEAKNLAKEISEKSKKQGEKDFERDQKKSEQIQKEIEDQIKKKQMEENEEEYEYNY